MGDLTSVNFDTHDKVIKFFKDLKFEKETALEFYSRLEAFLSDYIAKLIFDAHTADEMNKFKLYINTRNITDEVKIAKMLGISYERKTGKNIDSIISKFLLGFIEDINKASVVIEKYSTDVNASVKLQEIYQEIIA